MKALWLIHQLLHYLMTSTAIYSMSDSVSLRECQSREDDFATPVPRDARHDSVRLGLVLFLIVTCYFKFFENFT